jgi:hypothetical protein
VIRNGEWVGLIIEGIMCFIGGLRVRGSRSLHQRFIGGWITTG